MAFAAFKRRWIGVLAGCLLSGHGLWAQALPTRPVRSISPTDTDFGDLAFLRQEIGSARVVMLGEPTHGEGNVTEAKIRLLRYLQRDLGFTTVAFESGFYELDRAQRAMAAGTPVEEAIDNSVFGIWTGSREFRPLLPLLGPGQLRVAGFDAQFSGDYQDDALEELQALVKAAPGAKRIQWEFLEECYSSMGEHFRLSAVALLPFSQQVAQLQKLLDTLGSHGSAGQRERVAFWQQHLRSTLAMARDYAQNNPSDKGRDEFKATDSNPRDAQMADNLLWYLRQHPQEKVVCWGALPHLSNRPQALENAELQAYHPMGQLVKAALGAEAVYVLGTLTGGGTYGNAIPVPAPAAGAVEAELLANQRGLQFLSLKHDAPGRVLTTSAFDYTPVAGQWSEVVDGFLFVPAVQPPTYGPPDPVAETAAAAADTVVVKQPRPAARPAWSGGMQRGIASSPAATVSGTVVDARTHQPVPFATVATPARAATVADAQGRFRLAVRPGEMVLASCVGYESRQLAAPAGQTLTVALTPASYALANVQVNARSQDPRRIMKRVVRAIPANYAQTDETAQAYLHRTQSNFDTLTYETEMVMNLMVPAGFREYATFLRRQPLPEARVVEVHPIVLPRSKEAAWHLFYDHGLSKDKLDAVRLSHLFRAKQLRKYELRLDSIFQDGGSANYVISYKARTASRRTTGALLQTDYQGRIFVREADYAVTRYEAQWVGDSAFYNIALRKYLGKNNIGSSIFTTLFTDMRAAHTAIYTKWADGRYHLTSSTGNGRSAGRSLKTGPFFYQATATYQLGPLPADATPPTLTKGSPPEGLQSSRVPYRPEFWQTYQRPAAATPPATKP